MVEFNFTNLRQVFEAEKLKAFKEQNVNPKYKNTKKHISNFFIPTTSGTHVLIEGENIVIIQDETFRKVYLNRFPDIIAKWYQKEEIPKKIICDLHKPLLTT